MMDDALVDQWHMTRALELAQRGQGLVEPNPLVGCVIADAGGIVGEGWHQRFGGPHAEVVAPKPPVVTLPAPRCTSRSNHVATRGRRLPVRKPFCGPAFAGSWPRCKIPFPGSAGAAFASCSRLA